MKKREGRREVEEVFIGSHAVPRGLICVLSRRLVVD